MNKEWWNLKWEKGIIFVILIPHFISNVEVSYHTYTLNCVCMYFVFEKNKKGL